MICHQCETLRKRCESKDERIADLERELGLDLNRAEIAALAAALRVRPQASRLLLGLYKAKGRTLSSARCMAFMPPHFTYEDDRLQSTVRVMVYQIRSATSHGIIQTVFGHGYRITEAGAARVAAILARQGA